MITASLLFFLLLTQDHFQLPSHAKVLPLGRSIMFSHWWKRDTRPHLLSPCPHRLWHASKRSLGPCCRPAALLRASHLVADISTRWCAGPAFCNSRTETR